MKEPAFISALLLVTGFLYSQEPDSSSAIFGLREAERSFAKASVAIGRKSAFTEFLAERSVIFADKWITNGREFSAKRPAAPSVLKWEPEYINISSDRSFGVSTGPWETQEYRPNTKPLSTGYFLSVWEKQQDGTWKVILDAGTTTPVTREPHKFIFPVGDDREPAGQNPFPAGEGPEAAELRLLEIWKQSPTVQAYTSFFENDTRVMRNGHLPSIDRDTINSWISSLPESLSWKTSGSGASRSGDLGFTYGYLENPAGHYVRIWQKSSSGQWKVLIEMMNFN